MASKQTYECYVCKRNGVTDVRVCLDGKTDDGKTIYKNPDMSAHIHKQGQQPPQSQQQASTTIVTQSTKEDRILNLLADLTIKMNRVIKLLEDK
jgi:hypothetical protein